MDLPVRAGGGKRARYGRYPRLVARLGDKDPRLGKLTPDNPLHGGPCLLWRRVMPSVPAKRRSRRSSADTKARIVEAAQIAFSTRGYAQSVLTEIAESADVTAPLIIRYFGSKEGLFEEAFSQCLDGLPVLAADPADLGRMSVAMMTGGHEPTRRSSGMIAHSIGDPGSSDIAMRLIRQRVIGPLADSIG